MNKKILYFGITFFLINLVVKFWNIHSTPPSATYDEIIYIAEAQSIVKYGTDLTGNWRPWHFAPSDAYYTELTSAVLTPGFILFPNDPILASKFVPLLLGSLLPVLLGLLAFRLRRNSSAFVLTMLVATLNPWIFQFSRMGYDSLFSVCFYLLGIVLFLYLKKWQKLWSCLPLFLGFFQYQGHKLILVPLVGICLLFVLFEKYESKDLFKKYKQIIKDTQIIPLIFIFLFTIVLTVSYLLRLPHLKTSERISEFSFYDEVQLASQVNEERRIAIDSFFTPLFTNKYAVLGRQLTDRFLNSFNLRRLFIEGDRAVDTFTVLDYGYFHLIDILILMFALAFILHSRKDYGIFVFVLAFIAIGTMPNVVRTGLPWITFRGAFAFLGMIVLMGIGIASFYDLLKLKYKFVLVILYVLATTPFFFIYFYRYPVTHAKYIGLYERVVASYIQRISNDQKIVILPDRADATFNYLIAYNTLLTKENHEQVNVAAQQKEYAINTVKIESHCNLNITNLDTNTTLFLYFFKKPCEPQNLLTKITEIKSLIDAGTIFTVYNDTLCSKYELGRYPNVRKNILAVEKLSDQEFCQSFFSKQ